MWNSDFDRKTKYFKLKNQVFNPYTEKPSFFIDRENFSWKKSFLVISEILRPFVNTLTPDDKYSLGKNLVFRSSAGKSDIFITNLSGRRWNHMSSQSLRHIFIASVIG